MRANDPLYEIGLRLGSHKMKDEMWQKTLKNLAERFNVYESVETNVACVDPKLRWKEYATSGITPASALPSTR